MKRCVFAGDVWPFIRPGIFYTPRIYPCVVIMQVCFYHPAQKKVTETPSSPFDRETCRNSNPSCISNSLAIADALLCDHPVGSGVNGNSVWSEIKAIHGTLEKYNKGKNCPRPVPTRTSTEKSPSAPKR